MVRTGYADSCTASECWIPCLFCAGRSYDRMTCVELPRQRQYLNDRARFPTNLPASKSGAWDDISPRTFSRLIAQSCHASVQTSFSPSPRVRQGDSAIIPDVGGHYKHDHGHKRRKCSVTLPPLYPVIVSRWVHVTPPYALLSPD